MEKRIGTITILIRDREAATAVNRLLSEHADIILCRQGLPLHDRPVAVISLIVEGSVDSINALTGKLGRVEGVECKAVVTKNS
jgi:putative iron-only hydrogenase system regulator